ncbi:hypothetical protein P7K49_006358, partial [Saguinus oedipus]
MPIAVSSVTGATLCSFSFLLSSFTQTVDGIQANCDSSINLTFHKSKIATDELFTLLRDIAGARSLMKQFKSV